MPGGLNRGGLGNGLAEIVAYGTAASVRPA
jgi:hypothetical protein